MIIKKLKSHMGETKYDWLYSVHHFSFGDYYDSNNLGVGPLRVINEEDIETRLAQVWIIPDKSDYEPKYGQVNFKWEDRINKFLLIASGVKEAPIKINQNVNMYALYLEKEKKIKFSPEKGYGYYMAFFQGKTQVDELIIEKYEAIMGDENIEMTSLEDSHMLIFEIKKK